MNARLRAWARPLGLAALVLFSASCDEEAIAPPVITTVTVSLNPGSLAIGQKVAASVRAADQRGDSVAIGTIVWSTTAPGVATVDQTGMVTGVGAGTAQILATIDGRSGTLSVTVVAPPGIVINEVESNGGTPGDWVELYNPTSAAVSLAGWKFKDNDDTRTFAIAAGTTIPAGGYLVLEESQFNFGLGAPDAARLYSPYDVLVATYNWDSHAATTYGRCPNLTGAFTTSTTSTKGAANDCSAPVIIRINEVESNGGTPGDWVELYNGGTTAVNLGGYIFRDNNDAAGYTIPANTSIAPGGYLVLEEAQFSFGLGAADMARLFNTTGAIVDSYEWTAHAAVTYGRCPNATGAFAANPTLTKGAANDCGGTGSTAVAWPGADDVAVVDAAGMFTSNLSGLTYEGAGASAVLWAVVNGPGTLVRMRFNGTIWAHDQTSGWNAGKALRYPDGTGNPDSEGVTFVATSAGGMYVGTERNNDASTVSKNSILRFDVSGTATTLTATNEWNITADLPVTGANLGIEAITWIPDTFLTAQGFFDESRNAAYAPANYPNHGEGLFFVGVEANGIIYAYALNHANNTFTRVATISTGFTGVMDLAFDREQNYLWAICDDTCNGGMKVLEIQSGRFAITRFFNRPPSMPNTNNEGFTLAPQSECTNGRKPVYWSDDNAMGGNSIRRATMQCARF